MKTITQPPPPAPQTLAARAPFRRATPISLSINGVAMPGALLRRSFHSSRIRRSTSSHCASARARSVAIVGSRKVSLKGLDAARDSAAQLARAGVNVVSGYAKGVDTASHIAALEAGGTTTLVLATGLAGWWKKNILKPIWDWNRVLVVSEFELNDPWTPTRAFQRNGTICRLSRAVIVAEAARISGTMNTVRQLPRSEE